MWEGHLQVQHGTNTGVGSWMLLGEASWPRHHWPQTFQTLWRWSTMPVGQSSHRPCTFTTCCISTVIMQLVLFLPGGAPQSCQLSWALINTDHVPHVCTWYDFKLDVIEDFWTNHKQVVTIKFRTVIYFLLCHQNGWKRTFLTIYPLILAVLTNYPTFNVLFKLFTFSYLINHWAYERITRVHS